MRYIHELERGMHSGFEWCVLHNHMGYRNGYVKLSRKHPWWHRPYEDLNEYVDVHGGLTYARKGLPYSVPDFSYVWWIGFDCAHAGDAPDPDLIPADTLKEWDLIAEDTGFNVLESLSQFGTIKDTDYVRSECIALCEQAANLIDRRLITESNDHA